MLNKRFLSLIVGLQTYFKESSNKEKIELFIERAKNENAWFSDYLIRNAMDAIHQQFFNASTWEIFFETQDPTTLYNDLWTKIHDLVDGELSNCDDETEEYIRQKLTETFRFWKRVE